MELVDEKAYLHFFTSRVSLCSSNSINILWEYYTKNKSMNVFQAWCSNRTEQNMLYNMCHVILYNMCHVMLYNMCHVMLRYITCVMSSYVIIITCVMSCYITCVMSRYITCVMLCYITCVMSCLLYNICYIMVMFVI